jgi:hypothetical protein
MYLHNYITTQAFSCEFQSSYTKAEQILIIWGSPWTTTILFLVLYLFVRKKKVFNGVLLLLFLLVVDEQFFSIEEKETSPVKATG